MPYIRDSFWRGRQWESLDQMQTAPMGWTVTIAGRRRHRGLDGAAPVSVFTAVEADTLRPLPTARFELAPLVDAEGRPPDCHIE